MLASGLAGCGDVSPRTPSDGGVSDAPTSDAGPTDGGAEACFQGTYGTASGALTVQEIADGAGCSTAGLRGLSEQLVEEVDCIEPGAMARIDDIDGLVLGSAALPWLQSAARDGLAAAVAEGGELTVNSTLRSLPQQVLLYQWYDAGQCGITLAATPGTSPHESGLAIDTSQYAEWQAKLERHGWTWHGAGDLVHFDYTAGGESIAGTSVLAFQRLWNRNHTDDLIDEDGLYGPQTRARVLQSPAEGFPIGASCGDSLTFSVLWSLTSTGYTLSADPPSGTTRVDYVVDGHAVGSGTIDDGFQLAVGACADGALHPIEAHAFDASGAEVAVRSALLMARPYNALYVRPTVDHAFEIGLERPTSDLVAIEVDVDTFALTDAVTGSTRSARLAIEHSFSELGARHVVLRGYDASSSVLLTLEADVSLVATP